LKLNGGMQRRRSGLHLDLDGSAQAEAGAWKQWSAAEWLDGGKVVEGRRQLDDATAINGERQRWSELSTDGDDGTEERARPGLHDAAGENAAGSEENARSSVSRRKMAVGLQDSGAGVDDVMRDGVRG
jgi:hypothetical protein